MIQVQSGLMLQRYSCSASRSACDLGVAFLPAIVEGGHDPCAVWLDAPKVLMLGVAVRLPVSLLFVVSVDLLVDLRDRLLEVSLFVEEILLQGLRLGKFFVVQPTSLRVVLLAVFDLILKILLYHSERGDDTFRLPSGLTCAREGCIWSLVGRYLEDWFPVLTLEKVDRALDFAHASVVVLVKSGERLNRGCQEAHRGFVVGFFRLEGRPLFRPDFLHPLDVVPYIAEVGNRGGAARLQFFQMAHELGELAVQLLNLVLVARGF